MAITRDPGQQAKLVLAGVPHRVSDACKNERKGSASITTQSDVTYRMCDACSNIVKGSTNKTTQRGVPHRMSDACKNELKGSAVLTPSPNCMPLPEGGKQRVPKWSLFHVSNEAAAVQGEMNLATDPAALAGVICSVCLSRPVQVSCYKAHRIKYNTTK